METFQTEDKGLLALDRERASWSLSVPMADFIVPSGASSHLCVRYDGQFGDFHLWTWGDTRPDDCDDALRLQEWLTISDRSSFLFTG
jgi:hypothetical protein